ncbi:zinc ribbon domain-containing protein, partial [Synechococcus sp. H60.2]|uniref:zinc ribbon domain-containing protein n=1 Tax=Synechococcus sp. H60.2 TaxID=2964518 RepID=UPI0039C3EEBB
LSGRERRFQTWVNHRIATRVSGTESLAIVARAQATHRFIALEDLPGIRERTNQQPRSKTERRRANSWAFSQLRQFLEYKAARAGVKVVVVPPAYSSQTCHRYLWLGQREGKHFRCVSPACGWEGDADLNGANVIALLGVAVNRPRGPWLACQLQGYRSRQRRVALKARSVLLSGRSRVVYRCVAL